MINITQSLHLDLQNVHQGYVRETLARFLKARDGNVPKAHKMVDSFIFFLKKKKKFSLCHSSKVLYSLKNVISIHLFMFY